MTIVIIRQLKLMFGMVCASAALQGCATSKPDELWQDRLTHYVANDGHGDITCLRNTEPGEARPVFGATSGNVEVQGLLVGASTVNSQRWWTYIVGVSKDETLTDIRAVAVSDADGKLVFRKGPDDEAAVLRYRDSRFNQWKSNQLDGAANDAFACTFPGHNDVYTLQSAGNTTTVTEKQSGVRWVILFADDTTSATRAAAATGK